MKNTNQKQSINAQKTIKKDFMLKQMGKKYLTHIIAMQDHVYDYLPAIHKAFITPKTKQQFMTFMQKGQMIGCFQKNALIGQLIAASPATDKDLVGGLKGLDIDPEKAVIVQGVLVSPDHRKKGVMGFMVKQIMHMTKGSKLSQVWAEIARDNEASLRGFLANDFNIVAGRVDPADGCQLYFLKHDDDHNIANQNGISEELSGCLSSDYKNITKRLDRGDEITAVNWQKKTITWLSKPKTLNT